MLSFSPVRTFAVALLLALSAALLPAAGAQAEDRTVRGGRLDWGIKSSFLSYVTGPIAQGSWSLKGGAATVDSHFRFHSATGSYDPDSGAFRAGFSGGVRFVGHRKGDGSYELDLTISRPTVRISADGSGTLHADMTSRAKGAGKVNRTSQVPLAELDLSGIDMTGGSSPVTLTGVPATLTSQGAEAFAGYYTEGTELDPVSLSVDVATAGKPTATPTSKQKEKEKKKGEAAGSFEDAAVDWGVRRTYREYVTGPVAKGTWTLSEGAQDGGAFFRFPKGKGTYDAKKGTLDADFAGRIRFTGTELDLTLSKVAVRVKDGKGTLSADVTDAAEGSPPREAVPLVSFEAGDFTPKKGLASLKEAPAKLTSQGAKAFGSLYSAGTEMDPVSLAVAVDKKARLPALPDLGSGATASARATAATRAPGSAATEPGAGSASPSSSSSSSVGAGTYAAIGAGVLLTAGLAVYVFLRRRRANANANSGPDKG